MIPYAIGALIENNFARIPGGFYDTEIGYFMGDVVGDSSWDTFAVSISLPVGTAP